MILAAFTLIALLTLALAASVALLRHALATEAAQVTELRQPEVPLAA